MHLSPSRQISIEASHGDSKQSWVRAAECALLANASIWGHIIVREGVPMSVDICRMHQSRVMLGRSSSVFTLRRSKPSRSTYIRHRILVILAWCDFVRVLTSHQQCATVESSGETWDDSVRLAVGACCEGSGRAAEDVTGCWLLEGNGVVRV
jgi:hypothetical protein